MNEVQKALTVMCSLFRDFTPEKVAIYAELLKDIPPVLVVQAIKSLCLTSRFPPTVAEIRETAGKLYNTANEVEEPSASRAWGEVLNAISRVGYYRVPTFKDEICAEAVKRFGWRELCQQPTDTIGVARAQFMRIYDEIARKRKETHQMLAMIEQPEIKKLILGISDAKALPM